MDYCIYHSNTKFNKLIISTLCRFLISSCLIAAFSFHAEAQDNDLRPKLGLALSGGGSLGIAHLGVIKVMEESGLRPDYISGVSMGSVMGGFYSLGYSVDSILSVLKSADLNSVIFNKIPEDKIIFLEKRNFHNSIISTPVSLKKMNLPSGLTNGQVIENFLSFYAWPAATINDFSKLPIPFVCVASDILTVSIVNLRSGYLPQAIRASLAIPSVFTPVKIDDALLLDGGIYRNFAPVEVIRMGADIVIGSYTGFVWREEQELDNVSDILKQVAFSMGYSDLEEQKELVDYLILPDLKGFSSMDFSQVDSIYRRGYEAALPFREKFKKLADSLNSFGQQRNPDYILDRDHHVFDRIEITGNKHYSDRQITGILNIHNGDSVDNFSIKEKIDLLYGKNWFEKVSYRVEPRNDSLILIVECHENPKAMLYASLHYDNAVGSGALLSLSSRNFLLPRSWFNINTFIGKYYRVQSFFLQYMGWQQKSSLALNMNFEKVPVPVLHLKDETGNVVLSDFSAGLTLARSIGLNHHLSVTGMYENRNLATRYFSSSGLRNISYNYFRESFIYNINTLDTKYFPKKGTLLDITASLSDLQSSAIRSNEGRTSFKSGEPGDFNFGKFYTLKGSLRQYMNGGRKATLSIRSDILYTSRCDSAISNNNFHLLGGLSSVSERSIPMTGFEISEIPVKKAAGIGFEIDIEVLYQLHLLMTTDIFAVNNIYLDNEYDLLAGLGIGAGYMTVAGPIRAGVSYGKNPFNDFFGNINGYLSIGFNF